MNRLIFLVTLLFIAATPAIAGSDFSEVRTYLEESVTDGSVAGGAVLVLHRGEVIFETGFGFADLKTKKPFRIDTPGVIASISKPLLGTAVFHLVETGKLNVAIPISEYLPEFEDLKLESGAPVARAPTVIELFTHTSGLRNDDAPGGRPWFASWTQGQPLSFVVTKYARDFPFKAQPGTRYAYSGIGTDVAARVAEVTTGKPRNEMLAEEVCKPLGMTHTYYWDADRAKQGDPMPTRYYRGKNGNLLVSRKRTFPPPNTYSASGGTIISTVRDLSRWLLMIRNRGVHGGEPYLSPKTIEKMLNGHHIGGNARGGFFIRKKGAESQPAAIGHTGSSGTNCWIDFENDTIGIMLTQTRGKDIKPFRIELEKKITHAVLAAGKSSAKSKPPGNWIIPPPLEDLKKNYKVRLVYFVPSDREAKSNYREKAEVLMRVVADVFRREMKANNQDTRGLDFELDEAGRLKVHLVKAKNPAVFYTGKPFNVDHLLNSQQQEIWETTGFSRNRPILVFSEAGAVAEARPIPQVFSGLACVSGDIFRDGVTATTIEEQIRNFMDSTMVARPGSTEKRPRNKESQTSNGVLIHELGHIFGMLHDTRDPRNIMMRGYDNLGQIFDRKTALARPVRFSIAHARMAGFTRFFSESFDEKDNKPPSIREFKLASPARAGRKTFEFSLKLSDDKGLGSLIVLQRGGGQIDALVGEMDLGGKKTFSKTVRFECPRPLIKGQRLIYIMNIIDVNGNLSQTVSHSQVVP